MVDLMRITVYGEPAPQGSKRGFVNRKTGGVILVENNKDRLDSWREAVKYAALQVRAGAAALDGPIVARMVFSVRRPKGHYRSGKNAALLKTDAPSRPCSKPDLSKLLRSTEDALTDAGVWIDDARVVEYERAAKVFIGEDAESLDAPGVRIVVKQPTVGGYVFLLNAEIERLTASVNCIHCDAERDHGTGRFCYDHRETS